MKKKKLRKKGIALLLAMAMLAGIMPQLNIPAHGAEMPDSTKFATAEELKQFNTNNNDGATNPAKVYFGNNNQKWWIAGSQGEKELTLFAESPLATDQQFESNYSQNKTYSEDWNCTYTGENPGNVYPNHYGASPLRNTLKGLESSYFTSKEQDLMKNTTVYTNDTKNSSVYSTTNKLYLAYCDNNDTHQYVTVGKNASDSLNSGLRIDQAYWGGSLFWLRTPHENNSYDVVVVGPDAWGDYHVYISTVLKDLALVPAFELDTSNVLFGSSVPAVSSEGSISSGDAFTLRYSGQNLGDVQVSYDKTKIEVLSPPPDGAYLVVQNSDGAWAKTQTTAGAVKPEQLGLKSFENCKIWLEKTDSNKRITYATLVTEEQGYSINIAENTGLNIASGNGNQKVAQNAPITDIIVKSERGYHLPDGYIDSVKQMVAPLNVTKTDTGFTISGTPTSDINITLPEATRNKAPTPTATFETTANSITVNVTNHKPEYGTPEYSLDGTNWRQPDNVIKNLSSGTQYTVYIRYNASVDYAESDTAQMSVTTAPAAYMLSIPDSAKADGSENIIKVNESDLGYNGQVTVKIKDNGAIKDGKLTLTRNDTEGKTITSEVFVNGVLFTDLIETIATFRAKDDEGSAITFKKPNGTGILAGTYLGTVTFAIDYSE